MTFLEMAQQLHRDVGANGVVPTTLAGVGGEALRLKNWIIRSDELIQNLWHDWKFLRAEFTVNTTNSQATVVSPSDLNRWDYDTFQMAEVGGTTYDPIQAVEYQKVKDEFLSELTADDGSPDRVIVFPDNTLHFDPVPDGIYPFKADYFRKPTLLAADGDESAIPEAFHYPVIVARAMRLYANHEDAPEMDKQGAELYKEAYPRLRSLQLPSQMDSHFTGSGNTIEVIAADE